jgi:putative ABC transport system permease protein
MGAMFSLFLLARRNVFRDRLRASLTISSVGCTVLILTALLAVYNALQTAVTSPGARQVLALRETFSPESGAIPAWYRDELLKIDGIDAVMPWSYVFVQAGTVRTMGMAADAQALPRVMPPVIRGVAAGDYEAFASDRTGVLMGRDLITRLNWKVGDTVMLQGGSVTADFRVRIYGILDFPMMADNFLLHDAYLQTLRKTTPTYSFVFFHVGRPERIPEVRRAVEAKLAGQPTGVEVISLAEYVDSIVSRAGQASTLVLALVIAIALATVLVVGNTLVIATRQRAQQVAVLRAVGFDGWRIVQVVVGEALTLAVAGSLAGGTIAYVLLQLAGVSFRVGAQTVFSAGAVTAGESLATGAITGLMASIPAAWYSTRINLVGQMRGGR